MKNTTAFTVVCWSIACIVSSCNSQEPADTGTVTINYIDLEEVGSNTLTSVLPEPKYVHLKPQSKKEMISSIQSIKVFNEHIYILDSRLKKIVIYDFDGNPVDVLDKKGRGPNEYVSLNDFCVDKDNNLVVVDSRSRKILFYSPTLDFIKKTKTPFAIEAIHCLANDKFMLGLAPWNVGKYKKTKILLTDKNLIPEKVIDKYNEPVDPDRKLSGYRFVTTANCVFYHQPINENVIQFDDFGNTTQIYHFNFGSKTVPDKYKTNVDQHLSSEKYKSYATLLDFIVVTQNYIYGTILDKMVYKQFCINLKTEKVHTEIIEDFPCHCGVYAGANGQYLIKYLFPEGQDKVSDKGATSPLSEVDSDEYVVALYTIN